MGIMDRLNATKRMVWSPITVWMADQGSDTLVHAGAAATVVVDVRGEDDGTAQHVELFLQMTGLGLEKPTKWPLAELLPTIGAHTVQVSIPTGLAPACARYAEYSFGAELLRSKGVNSTAAAVVDVVARPDDAFWPDGPRSGQDGPQNVAINIDLAGESVPVGGTVSGSVTVVAGLATGAHSVTLSVGPVVDTLVAVAGKSQPQLRSRFAPTATKALAEATTLAAGAPFQVPFQVAIPEGVPPTLHNGGATQVVWQVRVAVGDDAAWRSFVVLDPEALAGIRNRPSPSLIGFLSGLEATPR